jgi:hypothetical protein
MLTALITIGILTFIAFCLTWCCLSDLNNDLKGMKGCSTRSLVTKIDCQDYQINYLVKRFDELYHEIIVIQCKINTLDMNFQEITDSLKNKRKK